MKPAPPRRWGCSILCSASPRLFNTRCSHLSGDFLCVDGGKDLRCSFPCAGRAGLECFVACRVDECSTCVLSACRTRRDLFQPPPPSPEAEESRSHYKHDRYLQMGEKFVRTKSDISSRKTRIDVGEGLRVPTLPIPIQTTSPPLHATHVARVVWVLGTNRSRAR